MAKNSKIEWTDHTLNLWWGCSKVHTGCKNCYAEHLSDVRYKNNLWGENAQRKRIKSAFSDLRKYQIDAESKGIKYKVFIGSMMDIFEDSKPLSNPVNGLNTTGDLRDELFRRITDYEFENLIFLFLTKRPTNIIRLIPKEWINNTPENVWFGTSVSNQLTAIELIPKLIKAPGKKFISVEPQISEVDITNRGIKNGYSIPTKYENGYGIEFTEPGSSFIGVDWVIQGGESGPNKRSFNIQWAYFMKHQCERVNVPFFFKQIDKILPIPEDLMIRQFPESFNTKHHEPA